MKTFWLCLILASLTLYGMALYGAYNFIKVHF